MAGNGTRPQTGKEVPLPEDGVRSFDRQSNVSNTRYVYILLTHFDANLFFGLSSRSMRLCSALYASGPYGRACSGATALYWFAGDSNLTAIASPLRIFI